MDIQRAKELLEVLADGVDPLTGEVLPDNHVCNKVEIVRALHCAVAVSYTHLTLPTKRQALHCAVEELSRRRRNPLPENNGKPWTEELDSELCRLFDEGMKKQELCAHFKRTSGSILSRLEKLGKM